MILKQFEETYKPIKQIDDRTYKKYIIPNDYRVLTYNRMSNTYSCNIFTGTVENNIMKLYCGRRFSLEDSFFIIVEKGWSDEEEVLLINLKKKK